MKKLIVILFLILAGCFAASAQLVTPPLWVATNPTFCTPTRFNTALIYNYTLKKLYKCSASNTWTEIGSTTLSIGNAVTSGTTGSVLFVNSSGNLAQSPSSFYFDSTNNRLKLGETSYVGTASGWNSNITALQVGYDTAVVDNTTSVYGGMFDQKRQQTAGTGQQTTGVRMRCWLVQTGGTGGTCTGTESFVRNLGSTVTTTLMQATEGIAQVEENATLVYGGYFQAGINSGGSGTAVNSLVGTRSNISGASGWTVTDGTVFDGYAFVVGGTMTNLYGLKLGGWSGSGAVNSIAVYIDDTTRRGSSTNYAIKSDSLAPSVFAGTVLYPKAVEAKTSSYSVAAADAGKTFTNEATGSRSDFTLPSAAAGLHYTFVVQDGDGLRVIAASGDTITFAEDVSAAAGNITSTTPGSVIKIEAINATEWVVTFLSGTWVLQ
jgi:hypothetical protein